MDPQHRHMLEMRIDEISRVLGLSGPAGTRLGTAEQNFELLEIEELYAERERLLQELEKDC